MSYVICTRRYYSFESTFVVADFILKARCELKKKQKKQYSLIFFFCMKWCQTQTQANHKFIKCFKIRKGGGGRKCILLQ